MTGPFGECDDSTAGSGYETPYPDALIFLSQLGKEDAAYTSALYDRNSGGVHHKEVTQELFDPSP